MSCTQYHLELRFWWPTLGQDVQEAVKGCAHCHLANATSHEEQLLLDTFPNEALFDVVFLDFWKPGDIVDKHGTRMVLTYVDCMTGFTSAAYFGKEVTLECITNICMSDFFAHFGLPRLIVVDADGLFQATFKQLFAALMIPVIAVSKENHKAVWNECFHCFLNKVECINSADSGNLHQWLQGVFFALYAWNAKPMDGMDIQ